MPLILGTNSIKDTGYNVDNSCRLNDTSSAYMHKTPGSTGVEEKFTFSVWLKFNPEASTNQCLLFIEGDNGSDDYVEIAFKPDGVDGAGLDIQYNNGTYSRYVTNRLFRDPSAWFHLVIAVDTTQAVAGNRHKIYVNGTQETSLSVETAIPQNDVLQANTSGKKMWLGAHYNGPKNFWDGYMAEVVWIDGTQYAASDFGEFDSDSPTIWKPKDVSGLTFGTNGFYLDFKDSSNLGNDANGGTDLTEVNLAAIDQATDTPTNNFATMNILNYSPSTNFTSTVQSHEGLVLFKQIAGATAHRRWVSTMGVTAGKWYFEAICTAGETNAYVGISDQEQDLAAGDNYLGEFSSDVGYNLSAGSVHANNSSVDSSEDTFGTSDIICVALDATNGKIYFRKNSGSWVNSGDPAGNSNGYSIVSGATYFPSGSLSINNAIMRVNFGNPIVANSSSVADANGYGAFEYTPPSGFLALCTKNLGSDGG